MKQARFKERLASKGGLGLAARALRKPAADAIRFIRGKDGRVRSEPSQVDEVFSEAWCEIMQGDGRPMQTAAAFVTKYAEYMVDGPPAD
eukprot:14688310-Alexandrium_andersonii.AAC.1